MRNIGLNISMLGAILLAASVVGGGIALIFICEGPAYRGCGIPAYDIIFGVMLVSSIVMIFLGTRFKKNKAIGNNKT